MRIPEVSVHDLAESPPEVSDRAEELGCAALCLSLVPQSAGRREHGPLVNRPDQRQIRDVWKIVDHIVNRCRLPLVVKGVMSPADAIRAIELGCSSIYVSNYGGRALDHCEGAVDVLAEVVEAAAGRAEVIVDGGFMRGTDVVKALAVGAAAVAIGRLQGLGLAAGGASGLLRALEILEDELRITMSLLGGTGIGDLGPAHIFRGAPPVQLPDVTSAFFRTP
jgi:isopentenyl diphosphate isomerase/L-lactate dehydrogenase-like FMN-dependent dehydrogenase